MNIISFPFLGWEFKLSETINVFGLDVYWYAIIIATGMVVAISIAFFEFKKQGVDTDDLADFVMFAIPLGILGARIYYVIFEWEYYSEHLEDIIAIWEGGLAIYGGVIVGALVAIVFTRVKKISFLWFADIATIGLFIAQSMGRWGNFVNGEAYGSVTDLPWGMMVNGSGPHHPTFLYESLWNLTGFVISYFIIYRFVKSNGASFAYYLIWYGAGRFMIEGLRTDSLYLIGDIRVSQVVALISVAIGIGVIIYMKARAKKQEI